MKNKKAMTLIELMLVIAIVGIVVSAFIGVIKPKIINRDSYKIKATLYSLQKVDEVALSKQRANGAWSFTDNVEDVCLSFIDIVNIRKEISCSSEGDNFVLANGVLISELSGEWNSPTENIKHPYIEAYFDINNEGEPDEEGKDIFNFRLFKDEAIIVPTAPEILTETNLAKYRVITLREKQNNAYIDTYKVVENTKNGVSFGEAACITGVADEFLTSEEKNSIPNCTRNTSACDRYFDCQIQIMDIPQTVVSFKGN